MESAHRAPESFAEKTGGDLNTALRRVRRESNPRQATFRRLLYHLSYEVTPLSLPQKLVNP